MSGLILKLAPNERILINGAVIQNGDRQTKFSIKTPNAHVLRLKDAIHPDMANTPVSRTCYIAQLILSGDAEPEEGRKQLLIGVEQLSQVFDDVDSRKILAAATEYAISRNIYQVLRQLKKLIPREARLFAVNEQ